MGRHYEWHTSTQAWAWDPPNPGVNTSCGPTRVEVNDKPDPDFKPRPVGFVLPDDDDEEADS